ncbi:D-alanyl-D-alanine carboxypeptidase/D-alanyl-D-alanine endopeptidase [Solimonas sp. K1W22B-7]|uniref:D-alanyl-D-alanine carboxypeptidase/D-alanyl-D-alanine endopeptidase n=1 Tax=Solimonas sp. K1W22B-7 TaxID=2303331 RepID=UPI0013C51C06|nr:D-alanyl-D-alanine carboxypeptidase/D-alanyl-D-alanine-endopeptidase [Solimonas sp. K1W22B-7]
MRLLPTLLLACLPLAAAAEDWPALHQLEKTGARVTAVAVDLQTGRALASFNPQQRLNAASLTKIVLAAAALEAWDPERTLATELYGTGNLTKGVLEGSLILQGQSDPTLEHRDLWLLAAQLRQAGVREVKGDLLISTAPLGRPACETADRCKFLPRSDSSYAAPLSGIGVDYGSWCVDFSPSLQPRHCSGVALPIPVDGRVEARNARNDSPLAIGRILTAEGERIQISGTLDTGSTQRVYRSMAEPAGGTGQLLWQMLAELGVRVSGNLLLSEEALPAKAWRLASVQGLTLREQLARMLRYSNNYIADVMTLKLAQEARPGPAPTLAQSATQLSARVVRARAAMGDGAVEAPPLYSGSGLTPENALSARDLVAVLQDQYRSPRSFPAFYAGLVVPADSAGTRMREGSQAWLNRTAFKTGTMSEPHAVFGIAGYARKQDGGWIAIAALANGAPGQVLSSRETLKYMRADVEAMLARY